MKIDQAFERLQGVKKELGEIVLKTWEDPELREIAHRGYNEIDKAEDEMADLYRRRTKG